MASNTTPPIIIPVILDSTQIEKGMTEINRQLRKGILPVGRGGGGGGANGIGTGGGGNANFGSGGGEAIAGVALGAIARGKRSQDTIDNRVYNTTAQEIFQSKAIEQRTRRMKRAGEPTIVNNYAAAAPDSKPFAFFNPSAQTFQYDPFGEAKAMKRQARLERDTNNQQEAAQRMGADRSAILQDMVAQNARNKVTPRMKGANGMSPGVAPVTGRFGLNKLGSALTGVTAQLAGVPGLSTLARAGPGGMAAGAALAGIVGGGMVTNATANLNLDSFRNQSSDTYNTAAQMRRDAYSKQTAGPIDNFLVGMGVDNPLGKGMAILDKASDSVMRGLGSMVGNSLGAKGFNYTMSLLNELVTGEPTFSRQLDNAKRANI